MDQRRDAEPGIVVIAEGSAGSVRAISGCRRLRERRGTGHSRSIQASLSIPSGQLSHDLEGQLARFNDPPGILVMRVGTPEKLMVEDMGIFRTTIEVAHAARPDLRHSLTDVMVDTGSEYNWIPQETLLALGVEPERDDKFETADGRVLTRQVGFARLFTAGRSAIAAVVFAAAGDMTLLGAVGLESLNLRVDLGRK